MKRTVLAVTAVVTLGSVAGLFAADMMPERGPIPFEVYDADKDGMITETEFDTARAKRMEQRAESGRMMRNAGNAPDFSFFDTDGDGKISPKELSDGQMKRMQERPRGMGPGGGMGGM